MTPLTIIYTVTDEAPALATQSLLPIIQAFARPAGIHVETRDISLAGRIIAAFSEYLSPELQLGDHLSELGELARTPGANIIKLPNISASVPQLKAAVSELQSQGYDIPDYPESPGTPQEAAIKKRYAKILGSAVNPVLREGNADRRVAGAVKEYARKNPHAMGKWSSDSRSHVAHMTEKDFYGTEQSHTMAGAGGVSVVFYGEDGSKQVLKKDLPLEAGEVIDASVMHVRALRAFYHRAIQEAKQEGLLLSLHLKATMMKVSDPYMFGQAVQVYFKDVFEKHSALFERIGVDPANGLGDIYAKLATLDPDVRKTVASDISAVYKTRPDLAMVDADRGVTNLHVPSDVIIDASMPACLRNSGKMWGPDKTLRDTKAMIPDRCYAGIYQQVFEFSRIHGAFDVTTMGSVANVGLMAKKAEEYGSHDKTFIMETRGRVQVSDRKGRMIFEHEVEPGDIWRMCQAKDEAIRDWVGLGVKRARATGAAAVFWLDPNRSHDSQLIVKVKTYLAEHDTQGIDIRIFSLEKAMTFTLERVRQGLDTIAITGNVLRDYLTDLFPILELGTSAKMLSIVPLLAGGGLYETGAGGTAPKFVPKFLTKNHLSWDSLGEFLALAASLEDLGTKQGADKALILSKALDRANARYLMENRSPSSTIRQRDNRGSHFYLALYWAEALADQDEDKDLKSVFRPVARQLAADSEKILADLIQVQGRPVAVGGYYHPDAGRLAEAMRPSKTFNRIIDTLFPSLV